MTLKRLYSNIIICFVLSLCATSLHAQVSKTNDDADKATNDSILNIITNIDERIKEIWDNKPANGGFIVNEQSDSLMTLDALLSNLDVAKRNNNGIIIFPYRPSELDESLTFRDTVIFQPALLPIIFEGKILPPDLNFVGKGQKTEFGTPKAFHLIDPNQTMAPLISGAKKVQLQRKGYYTRNIQKVQVNALAFSDSPVIGEQVVEKKSAFKELVSTNEAVSMVKPDIETTKTKRMLWKKNGEHTLQLSQNQLSQNWNGTGGENNFAVLNYHKLDFNYKRDKFSFNNSLEWKLDVMRTPADTLHNFSIKDDYVRVYSVAGMQAFKNWSYSMKFEAKTQIFNSYAINSLDRRTSFLSPLVVNVGLGMSYNLEKVSKGDKRRNMKLSVDLSPISINYTYVRDEYVTSTRFGLEEGDRAKTDFGSNVNVNFVYNFNRYVSYGNRFSFFTNYSKVKTESENKFNFAINQYFTTSINLHLRFDDAIGYVNKDRKWGYFQYNEVLGFGLGYKW